MGLIKDLEISSPGKIFVYFFTCIALLIPGASFLYFFKFETFRDLEIIKLILVSLIYSVPLFFINLLNSIVLHQIDNDKENEDEENIESKNLSVFLSASYLTIASYSLALVLGKVLSLPIFGYSQHSITLFLAYGGSLIHFIVFSFQKSKKKNSRA